eukprot:TRINITY_DN1432_c0_g1_i3.p1 TRINITY_DN1432_c0_g1~~TRINITY_DN1432_c0_g1_i3.p1  ORF type:complete len:316 (-),score=58.72 TRINITY_DN1432_c0_g1_i3:68-1015(-)
MQLRFLFISLAIYCTFGQENERPVVGILTQPTSSTGLPKFEEMGYYYIPSSYVKWIESAGGRVVPIPYDADQETLKKIFNSINGLLYPGGDVDLPGSVYLENSIFLYKLALEANDKGDYFPIWGTCQGFEELLIMTSGNTSVLERFDAEDYGLPLQFTPHAANSKLFRYISPELFHHFEVAPLTENLHEQGITPEGFNANGLSNFYTILSTNLDRNGKEFISTMEAQRYPIYSTQWHPERNQFEWDSKEPIDHSLPSLQCVQYLANFFVQETKKNNHQFTPVYYDLIDKYCATYTMDVYRYYVTCYLWNQTQVKN